MKLGGATWVAIIVGTAGLLAVALEAPASADPKPAATAPRKPVKAAKAKKPPAAGAAAAASAAAADHCAIDDLGYGDMLAKKSDAPPAPAAAKSGKPRVDMLAVSKAAADKFDLGRKSRDANRPTDGKEVKMQAKVLSMAVVAGVVAERRADLEYCMLQVPEAERGSEEFTLHLTIAAKGAVLAASVSGADNAAKIEPCVQSQVKRWTFPQGDTTTDIDYPLSFHLSN